MSSGRVELSYTGIQDTFLTGSPQFTHFQKVYKRYTQFALQTMDTPLDGAVGFGMPLVCTIPRMGDLIRTVYVRVTLSQLTSEAARNSSEAVGYVDSIGNALIDYADLVIGGQTVQRISGEFMEIYDDMWVRDSQQGAINALTGRTGVAGGNMVPNGDTPGA